ncbi:MAG TPA: hypothetical protein VJ725_26165 [Thermoanaerobaculia bacterium]|nr:hypothetical protein [Thermoanaerobaculia bacterium]
MLQLINYDLQEPVKNYDTLKESVEHLGGGIHILNGPWIYGADRSPREVLAAITGELAMEDPDDRNDKLLVFPVHMGELGTGRNLKHRSSQPHRGGKVFAVTCTSRNPSGPFHTSKAAHKGHRIDVTEALNSLGNTCHPLESLWFVKTDHTAHDVHLALEKAVPLNPKDELMVAEVDLEASLHGKPVRGAEEGLDPEDRDWLVKARVL